MEAYSYSNSYSSSSSKSSYLTQNHEAKSLKGAEYSIQSPHSVRKSQAKAGKKAPVAPPPPTPVKVYKVDPVNFRDLVQQLTGAPEFKPQLLQSGVTPTTTTSLVASRDIAAAATNKWYMQGHI